MSMERFFFLCVCHILMRSFYKVFWTLPPVFASMQLINYSYIRGFYILGWNMTRGPRGGPRSEVWQPWWWLIVCSPGFSVTSWRLVQASAVSHGTASSSSSETARRNPDSSMALWFALLWRSPRRGRGGESGTAPCAETHNRSSPQTEITRGA